MKTLADMTEEKRGRTIGMWADAKDEGRPVIIHRIHESDDYVELLIPSKDTAPTIWHQDAESVTPRFDLLPAWTPHRAPTPSQVLWGLQFQPVDEDEWYLGQHFDSREEALEYLELREEKDAGIFRYRVAVTHRPLYTWTPA